MDEWMQVCASTRADARGAGGATLEAWTRRCRPAHRHKRRVAAQAGRGWRLAAGQPMQCWPAVTPGRDGPARGFELLGVGSLVVWRTACLHNIRAWRLAGAQLLR
eukprot:365272-Chlamydomonas_euryale.AAC.19